VQIGLESPIDFIIKSILYMKKIHGFEMAFSLPIITLNKFDYKNVILLVSLKEIRIYILYLLCS